MKQGASDPDALGAGSDDFLNLFSLVALGYMWCRMTEAATTKLAASPGAGEAHLRGKLVVGRFFVEKMLPETGFLLARIKTGAATVMALPEEAFWSASPLRKAHGKRRIASARGDGIRRRDRRRRPAGLAAAIR
jgi:hypothetical protein